jgi:hypothetical protein
MPESCVALHPYKRPRRWPILSKEIDGVVVVRLSEHANVERWNHQEHLQGLNQFTGRLWLPGAFCLLS